MSNKITINSKFERKTTHQAENTFTIKFATVFIRIEAAMLKQSKNKPRTAQVGAISKAQK